MRGDADPRRHSHLQCAGGGGPARGRRPHRGSVRMPRAEGSDEPVPMKDALAHCEALVCTADKDRFLTALFAPAERRGALHALYAFNIEIARVRKIVREPLAGEIRLQWWNDAIAGQAAGEVQSNPVAAALLAAVARYELPPGLLTALI